jgi:hypothetical protein
MKTLRPIVLVALCVLCGCSRAVPTTVPREPGWVTYTNAKYGYEVQYPPDYEAWPTGPEGAQDGASLRVGYKEYAALTPMLDILVAPRTPPDGFPTLGTEVADMTVSVGDVTIEGRAAKEAGYRWEANGELAFVEVYLDGVVFRFMAPAGLQDFHDTPWWEIISSFRLREG